MDIYGLIGKKLSHSFSPAYFKRKFKNLSLEADYKAFELAEVSEFPKLIKDFPDLKGLNVTIPYKKDIIPFLDELDPVAIKLGAVNTIKVDRIHGSLFLKGYNTDIVGFEKSLLPMISERKNLSALILGTGGSAQAVAFVLGKLGINFSFVSRFGSKNKSLDYSVLNKEIILNHHLIINTTPLGMFPDTKNAPQIPYSFLTANHILFELIYNPSETVFMKKGIEAGATVTNGLIMLELQAEASWDIFGL